jgi:hypothetical protein
MQTLLQMLKSEKKIIQNVRIVNGGAVCIATYKNEAQEVFDLPQDIKLQDKIYYRLLKNNKLRLPF